MLSEAAREAGAWLIGGEVASTSKITVLTNLGSIPERTDDGKLYNTATIYAPDGRLVDIHRKVHLFDIDIPGKITFKVCSSTLRHLHTLILERKARV